MLWVYVFVGLGGVLALARIVVNVRRYRQPREDGWDAKQIALIRNAGANPFEPQDIDFFLAFADAAAAAQVATGLRSEGFTVAVRTVADSASHPVVLDVRQRMQLAVPQMQALSSRWRALAEANAGRYDGWSAAGVHASKAAG